MIETTIPKSADEYILLPSGKGKKKAGIKVDFNLTDTGNAELLASMVNEECRYDHRRGRWLLWSAYRWQPDRTQNMERLAVESARLRYNNIGQALDLGLRTKAAQWAIQSESRMRVTSMLKMAESLESLADPGDTWDLNTWLLGVGNGVVDLKTGKLQEKCNPTDHITMSTNLEYYPDATCERWEQFLEEVFEDDSLIDWLWRALGYTLTGEITEQCVFIGYGKGANGKGVFANTLQNVFGDYAYSSPFSTFEMYSRSSVSNDLAALEFRRLVCSSETNDNTRLNEARIKALSGGDPITARFLHQEFFTFMPHLKLWLFVNHKPKVNDDSHGFWRRVRLIPFTKQFTTETADKQLSQTLRSEAEGILTWLVRGCQQWQDRGLTPIPEVVKAATDEYRQESDPLANFISTKCIEEDSLKIKASVLYNNYKLWANDEGLNLKEMMSSTAFGKTMGEKYQKKVTNDGIYYFGIDVTG